jgi:hypothetical protein
VLTILFQRDGDIGLEIAPGNEVEDLSLIEDVGNIWWVVCVECVWGGGGWGRGVWGVLSVPSH